MSQAIPVSTPGALQFDYVEPVAAPQLACAGCATPLEASFHRINAAMVCTSCRTGVEAQATRGGFAKALLFGTAAAVAGWIIYFMILKVTGYELSLISILVGYMVGRAVSEGCGGRGGKRYQALAIGLTYLSITCTYVPLIMEQWAKDQVLSGTAAVIGSVVLSLAMPFLMITENPLTLLIVGFGLYQAWTMNKRRVLDISGPHPVAPALG